MKTPNLPQLNADINQLPEEIGKRVWQQFQRDLYKIGQAEEAPKEASFPVNKLLTRISHSLSHLLSNNEEQFWQLLYVVDLPEAYLEKIQATEKGIDECARIVLIREWQKVILRQHFSAT